MWYEVLPTIGLVFGTLALPPYVVWGFNKLFLNGKLHVSSKRH